jgi:hypothetical protein
MTPRKILGLLLFLPVGLPLCLLMFAGKLATDAFDRITHAMNEWVGME